jgi:hypothetical protein
MKFDDSTISKNISIATEFFKAYQAVKAKLVNYPGGTTGFIPFTIDFLVDGISGIKIYDKLIVDSSFLPLNYDDSLEFIVTGIDHSIKDGDWETNIKVTLIPKFDELNQPVTAIDSNIVTYQQPPVDNNNNNNNNNSGGIGDLYTWSKGYASTAPDDPESYVAQILKQRTVPNKPIPKPTTSPPTKTFEGNQINPKTKVTVFVTQYATTPLSIPETERFYKEIFTQLGAPTTIGNTLFMRAWRQFEGGTATYNPFNATQKRGDRSNYNTSLVQNYLTFDDGVSATVENMKATRLDKGSRIQNYPNIIKAFKKGIPDQVNAQKLANLLQRKVTFDQAAVDALINSWS